MLLVIAASSPGVLPLVVGTLLAAMIAAFAAVYGPIRLAKLNQKATEERELAAEEKRMAQEETDRQRARDNRLEDIERSEEVARQVKDAADRAEEARLALAADNVKTAKEALRQQEAVALQAQEAARLLAESNERIAENTRTNAELTQAKLTEIKILVDGSYTAAMRGELNALKAHRATLQELIADRKGSGREPGKATVETLETLETEINNLEKALADRLEAVAAAEAAGQTGLT